MSTFLKSANFSGKNGSYFSIHLYYSLSQDPNSNSSNITYELYLVSGNASGSGSTWNAYINNGWVGSGTTMSANTTVLIGTRAETVYHNDDGTKNVGYSADLNTPWTLGNAHLDGNFDLPRIDRYAQMTGASGFTDEAPSNPSFTYYNPRNLTMSAWLEINPNGEHICTRTVTGSGNGTYTWTLTDAERNQLRAKIPNSNTATCRIGIYSTIGSTQEASYRDVEFRITNANPEATYEELETNATIVTLLGSDSASTVVQNASQVQYTITATPKKSASISRVIIKHNNKDYSTTLSSGKYVGTVPISANTLSIVVTDSRNNSRTYNITKSNFVNYKPVDIASDFTIKRLNATSSTIRFNLTATYYQITLGSTANEPHLYYKLDNGNFVEIPKKDTQQQIDGYEIDTTNHKITLSNYDVSNLLVYTSPGQFTLYLEDFLTSDQEAGTNGYVTKGIPTFDAGEHDLKVNGNLYVADTSGNNKVNIKSTLDTHTTKITALESTWPTNIRLVADGNNPARVDVTITKPSFVKIISYQSTWGYGGGQVGLNTTHNIPSGSGSEIINLWGTTDGHDTEAIPIYAIGYYDITQAGTYRFSQNIWGSGGSRDAWMVAEIYEK
jgi:hypothetical protein